MVSILYKCPHFYFPRVYSLRITFVDHRYSLIQARKERLKSQKIRKFNGLTRRKRQAARSLRFDGIPFQIVGVKILEYQNGPDRNKALKRKAAKKKMQEDVSTSRMQGRVLDQVA